MTLRKIPQKPVENPLPGIVRKSKSQMRYEQAFWPSFRQDQHTLMPCEELAPPQDLYQFGGRVWNMSKVRKWSRGALLAFYKAACEEGDFEDRPGVWYAVANGYLIYQEIVEVLGLQSHGK
jgi:hypothetical protein